MNSNIISREIVLRPVGDTPPTAVTQIQDALERLSPIQALIDAVDSSTATQELADNAQVAVLGLTSDLMALTLSLMALTLSSLPSPPSSSPPSSSPKPRLTSSTIFIGVGVGLMVAASLYVLTLEGPHG